MAQDTRRSSSRRWNAAYLTSIAGASRTDAQAHAAELFRTYHRQVEQWFVEFAYARARQRKRELARAPAAGERST